MTFKIVLSWGAGGKCLILSIFVSLGSQVFSSLQESSTGWHVRVTWEDKNHHSKNRLLPPFCSAVYAEHDVIWYGIYFLVGVSCSSCLPPKFLCISSLLNGKRWKAEVLILHKHCAAIAKPLLGYWHYFHHRSEAWPHTSHCEENYLCHNKDQQEFILQITELQNS